ncbi:bifunctional tetrahydrofolate synthase/dihydrofolate synthase [Kushneria aurantia]|uniref:Dihydrofolate synthase/folylpolyglutamate synthase n=1 Tax=Kushneria aurantia TaxID=504092 RepID=A0ABV6G6D3_9GAMM|nr:bifunctional tetrahydrofolate synthase/dihydrofolate synthase [Kushneria aurantia]
MSRTLTQWLAELEQRHLVTIDMGLERVGVVADRLELRDRPLAGRLVTVAGTNGKGSTAAMLEALGRAHGLTTALYTSPHLLRYNERLRIDGHEVEDRALIAAFERIDAARGDISLTYFEMGTLAALLIIAEHRPELAVLEVGLGGRLDATNVVDADVAIVTSVALDHADYLGDDLEQIGREKAGIMRSGRPAVLGSRDMVASVGDYARELGVARLLAPGDDFTWHADGEGWCWRCPVDAPARLEALPDPALPLDNAAAALMAFELAGVEPVAEACSRAFAGVQLAGRMQWVGRFCLDVAHNPHAADYLARHLAERPSVHRIALLGMLADKEAAGVIEALAPVVDAWLPVTLGGARGREAASLAALIEARHAWVLYAADSPAAGLDWLVAHNSESEVLVCGSFFTVAEALEWLDSDGALQGAGKR